MGVGAILIWLGETAAGAILKALYAKWLAPKSAPAPILTTVAAATEQLKQMPDAAVADAIERDGL